MADGRLKRVKLAFERDFTQIPNDWLRDPKLSLGARGLLALLMSHKDGYVVTHKTLVATNPEGSTALQRIVDELKSQKYLTIIKERGNHGRIAGYTWLLTDPAEEKRRSTPYLDMPDPVSPDLDNPDTENRRLKEAQQEEQLTQVKEPNPSTRAGEEAASYGALLQVAAENDETRRQRLIHQPCPFRSDGKEHPFTPGGNCPNCGIRSTQRWDGDDIVQLDDALAKLTPREVVSA